MRILVWHVHGSWTTSFVQGQHEYVVPVLPDRSEYGRGRARTYDWPESVREVPAAELADLDVDVVVVQRPHELELVRSWLGRRPGHDVPTVYVEHDPPREHPPFERHLVAARPELVLVHVTHTNALLWDNGSARTCVIEHGIVDPGACWTGELARAAVVVNEPARRSRVAGIDLLPALTGPVPVDLFGIGASELVGTEGVDAAYDDLDQPDLHRAMCRRRVYVHPYRWTSLGLSLLEAMHLAIPVVVLGSTEAWHAVPPGAGAVSVDPAACRAAVRELVSDVELARRTGAAGRASALERYGLKRFLDDWDRLLLEVTR